MTRPFAGGTKTITLGGGPTVNRLGFGAMHLTGPGMWGPPADMDNAVRVLRRAVDLGVNFIDTADAYGPGDNERLIRQALAPYPDGVVICTKGGMLRTGPTDWVPPGPPYIMPLGRPAYLRQQVELSLRNLGTDCITLYQLHSADPLVPLADQLGELIRLRDEGKIRYIGISGQPEVPAELLHVARTICPDLVCVENLYHVADRNGIAALRYAEQHGLVFIPWFPLGHGDLLHPTGPLSAIARDFQVTSAQLALAWLLHDSLASLPIPGTTRIEHLEQNMRAAEIVLTAGDMQAINDAVANAGMTTERPRGGIAPPPVPETVGDHPNATTLRAIYADLPAIAGYCDADVILHAADRELPGRMRYRRGVEAVQRHEREFVATFDGTLVMDVRHLWADEYFGVVSGSIRGHVGPRQVAMPFCGLWRFRDRRIVEHWENAYDSSTLASGATPAPPAALAAIQAAVSTAGPDAAGSPARAYAGN